MSYRRYDWDQAERLINRIYGDRLRQGEHIVIWEEESEGIFGKSIERANAGRIDLDEGPVPEPIDTATIPWHLARMGYSSRVGTRQRRKYVEIWLPASRRKGSTPSDLSARSPPPDEEKTENHVKATERAVAALENVQRQSPFEYGKWRNISESDIRKIAILRVLSSQTRVSNLRDLEYSEDLGRLLDVALPDQEIQAILRKHRIRFADRKVSWVKGLRSMDLINMIRGMEKLSGASLEGERRARDEVMRIPGMGLKTASDFLKDIGFSKYLAVLDSRNLGFLKSMELAGRELKTTDLSMRRIYYELEEAENELAGRLGITVSELDERIMTYTATGRERPHKL